MQQSVILGSDHAGYELKNTLKVLLQEEGWYVEDLGAHSKNSCDYADIAHAACRKVIESACPAVLICGTGIGMSMAANRHASIRAAVCSYEFHARAAREHNDANILCLGERVTAPGLAMELVKIFLSTPFTGGRHQRRIEKIEPIAQEIEL